ncbi:chemotaxis protein CheW [Bacillus sp. M6-12]|uniref:chemotaxis protein CheW n=1 Tax=Bacillus sp. M6-12 TaxID=2054166 RepID=UPI000C76F63C|nr:chemotaxis protein CheW [Bacillus sp. M6-12]PLS19137.1 chemotaxis protein CheW [Bacillus sp. M6-12]
MTSQIVVFELEGQFYGVDIKEVNEIIRMQEITSLPNSQHHVEGIINLRGKICSVINGRILLGLDKKAIETEQKIIVLDGARIGVVVDQVSEILTVEEADKKGIEGLEALKAVGFIEYLVEADSRIISVLRLKDVLTPSEEEEEPEPVALEA